MATDRQFNAAFDALKDDLFAEINNSPDIPFWAHSSVTGFLTDDKIRRATKKVIKALEDNKPTEASSIMGPGGSPVPHGAQS